MYAIITRYAGPTDTLGARIIATVPGALAHTTGRARRAYRLTMPYAYELETFENHERAARALRDTFGAPWSGGIMAHGTLVTGYAFTLLPSTIVDDARAIMDGPGRSDPDAFDLAYSILGPGSDARDGTPHDYGQYCACIDCAGPAE